MAWFDIFRRPERIDEATKAFKGRGDDALSDKEWKIQSGEGIEDVAMLQMSGSQGIMGFNSFFNSYINKSYENEVMRILNYRSMAEYPEIGDVIEDACNEACKPDDNLNLINLNITDDRLKSNENIRRILQKEFEILFFERLDINDNLWDLFRSYMIDGRLFYERVVNPNKINSGIINIKKLPAETMDYEINPINGRITTYYQYLMPNMKRPLNRMEAEKLVSIQNAAKMPQLIIFNPEQVGFIHYGVHGRTLYEILGFLEKAKVPYNQLKLLETSVIIYRLVRSPERLVFKIDTGNMPRDKSIKYVERIKQKFVKKQTFNPMTGALSQEPEIFCIKHDTEIPLLDGRFLTLDQIISEHEQGKENWVYSINQETLNIEPGKIINAKITRPNTEMIRVYTDENDYIDCTPDHKFILRDGSECRADMLNEGVFLMPVPVYEECQVYKIEKLNNTADCGCIEVDKNHNFAVSIGHKPLIFLKNSLLENFYLPVGCLNLLTNIDLVDGRSLPLSTIIDEFESGKKNHVYTVDQKSGRIGCGEIEWAGITRKNSKLVRVHLDNGEFIDCTPDHKFLVWKDETKSEMMEVEAQNLTEEMELVEYK